MITRFYVDNYKCLTNFEYKPKPFELVLGSNGTGKTTVFEALRTVRDFIWGDTKADDLFPASSITRWQQKSTQRFELDVEVEGAQYEYALELSHSLETGEVHVHKEELKHNQDLLFAFERRWAGEETDEGTISYLVGEVWIRENIGVEEMTWVTGNRSVLSQLEKRQTPLSFLFRESMRDVYLARLNPLQMSSYTNAEVLRPSADLSNFAWWYRHLSQTKQSAIFNLYKSLHEVINGFEELRFDIHGETARTLKVLLRADPNSTGKTKALKYDLEELSDGQRALIALYTMLHCTLEPNTTLVIDEPENYVALSELQPWLAELRERVEERGGQVILISHHPEFINALAPQDAVLFKRDEGGPVRIVPFRTEGFEGLTPAEIMARGWES